MTIACRQRIRFDITVQERRELLMARRERITRDVEEAEHKLALLRFELDTTCDELRTIASRQGHEVL
jgi:hypothetical protein